MLGVPFPSTQLRLVSLQDDTLDVEDGQPGEIIVRGPQVFDGYLNAPEETARVFTSEGWFKTGDIGVNADGFISMADRKKELILSGGFNVYPSQVEAAIRSLPGVADVAVVGVPVADATEEVTAAIIMEEGAQRLTLEQCGSGPKSPLLTTHSPARSCSSRSCRATRWARSCAARSPRSCARSSGAEQASTAAIPRQLVDRCLRLIDRLAEGNS